MDYQVGTAGRIIAARLYEGEDIYSAIESIALKEDIKAGCVLVTGGLRKAEVVVGPKQEKPRIVGDFRTFDGPGEMLGVGTIYWDQEGPKLHLHAAAGKAQQVMVGCPRGGASVFLVLEVTIIEINDIKAKRELDITAGVNLLKFK